MILSSRGISILRNLKISRIIWASSFQVWSAGLWRSPRSFQRVCEVKSTWKKILIYGCLFHYIDIYTDGVKAKTTSTLAQIKAMAPKSTNSYRTLQDIKKYIYIKKNLFHLRMLLVKQWKLLNLLNHWPSVYIFLIFSMTKWETYKTLLLHTKVPKYGGCLEEKTCVIELQAEPATVW